MVSFADVIGCESKNEEFFGTEKESEKETVHPNTLVAILITPGSKKFITVRGLLDTCASESLIFPKFIENEL